MSGRPFTIAQQRAAFWAKVDKSGECWLWTGARLPKGYGAFGLHRKMHKAHRVAYRWLVGNLPADLTIDHLCLNKLCVNPGHLEVVTLSENVARGNRQRRLARLAADD